MVLGLKSKANDEFRVIEKSFPTGYQVGKMPDAGRVARESTQGEPRPILTSKRFRGR
ncbi:MAG: hypothetical protein JOZ49_24025 [Mycolicibacterium sp.]|nr:hypothetical protein [Mycolicibacterium sp.]